MIFDRQTGTAAYTGIMLSQRHRPLLLGAVALLLIWGLAFAGYRLAQNAKVTPEKVRAFVAGTDFDHLSAADRAAALKRLADELNALSLAERQRLQSDRTAYQWFTRMTEAEKSAFLNATMPTGFHQMINAFEQMPHEQRERAVNRAVHKLRDLRDQMALTGQLPPQDTNAPVLSQDLQDQVTRIGLQSFYSQSSAQSKAELAPFLEELQQTMESGRMLRLQGGP